MTLKPITLLTAAGAAVVLAASGCGMLPGGGSASGGGESTGSGDSGEAALDPVAIVEKAVNGASDADTYTATMTMSGSIEGASMDTTSDIQYTADPEPTVKMETMGEAAGESTLMMRGSEALLLDPGSGDWLRFGPSNPRFDVAAQNPLAEVEKLLAAEGVEEAGEEEVSGEATTHYTGSFTAEEAAAEVRDEEMAELARETYAQLGVESVDFEIWVDGDGLPRKVTHSAGDAVTTVLEFEAFNEPVDISYPSDDEITDFDQMMEDMGA